jgi:hypothetical protein
MKLSSVRSLKEEVLAQVSTQPGLPEGVAEAFASGTSVRALSTTLRGAHIHRPSEVSVGVARGASARDFRLGVRVHATGSRAAQLARACEKRSRGEVDIRIVPHVVAAPPSLADARRGSGPRQDGSWFRKRRRPLEAGLSVGHTAITAGTIGFIVEDADAFYLLSNNHVLANVNEASPGDLIVQPGRADAARAVRNIVGVLDRFIPISFSRSNVVDCAVASLLESIEFYVGWTEALPGRIRGVRPLSEDDLGLKVRKAGRTTGVTRGIVTQVEIDRLRVDMGEPDTPRVATFSDQFEVIGEDGRPFSLGGDSGSLIVDEDGFAVGLLFAGGQDTRGIDLTFANRIETVLEKLGVQMTLF